MNNKVVCLLVDDDIDDKEIFEIALNDLNRGIVCHYAPGGVEALDMLAKMDRKPDFIFLDLNMPRMNGNQCLSELKKNPNFSKIPVIMYSTSSNPVFIEESKKAGAQDYIIKPPSIGELSKTLAHILPE